MNLTKRLRLFFIIFLALPIITAKTVRAGDFGYNIYNIAKYQDSNDIAKFLDYVKGNCGTTVIRFWGFEDVGVAGIQRVLQAGEGKGIKFIISLADFNGKDESWFTNGRSEHANYAAQVAAAVKGNPNVLALEIANEPHCQGGSNCAIVDFMRDVSNAIRNAGWSGLISPGMKGFPGEDLADGTYQAITALPNITANSCHYYNTDSWGLSGCQTAKNIVKGKGKYFYVGEAGIEVSRCTSSSCVNQCSGAQLESRKNQFSADNASLGPDAYIIWQFNQQQNGVLSCDKFTVFENDPLCGGTGGTGLPEPPSAPGPPAPTTVECRDGIRGLSGGRFGSDAISQRTIDYYKDLGVTYTRFTALWDNAESWPTYPNGKPTFDFTEADKAATAMKQSGVQDAITLFVGPSWWYADGDPNSCSGSYDSASPFCKCYMFQSCKTGNHPWCSQNTGSGPLYCGISRDKEDLYREAIRTIVGHFYNKFGLKLWEFWNEPENYHNGFDPGSPNGIDNYAWALKVFYEEAKKISPSIKVAFNANWTDYGPKLDPNTYDAAVIHPYPTATQPVINKDAIQTLRNGLLSVGKRNAKIWITEWGYEMLKSPPGNLPVEQRCTIPSTPEADQAQRYKEARDWLNSQGDIEYAIFFILDDRPAENVCYGMLTREFWDPTKTPTKRPVYNVFKDNTCSAPSPVALNPTCQQPLPALPEEGCVDCAFGATASDGSDICGGWFGNLICTALKTFAISYTGALQIDNVKVYGSENQFASWYGNVDDNGNIDQNRLGRLAYLLSPEDAKIAIQQDQAKVYKSTPTEIEYDVKAQGLTTQKGYGSSKEYIYGTENAASVAYCALMGAPDDPACQTTTADIKKRTSNYIALINSEGLDQKYAQTTSNTNLAEENKQLIDAAKKIIQQVGEDKILASLGGSTVQSTAENAGQVLADQTCPPKTDTPQLDPCEKAVVEPKVSGVTKAEKTCTTTYSDDGHGNMVPHTDCSHAEEKSAVVAPNLAFATGSTYDGQLGTIPAANALFAGFYPPDQTLTPTEKFKQKNDGEIDFTFTPKFTNDAKALGLEGIISLILKAAGLLPGTAPVSNVPQAKKAECYDYTTTKSLIQPPGLAKPVDDACVDKTTITPPPPTQLCSGSYIIWNNANSLDGASLGDPSFGSTDTITITGLFNSYDPQTLLLSSNICGIRDCKNKIAFPRMTIRNTDGTEKTFEPNGRAQHIVLNLEIPRGSTYKFWYGGGYCFTNIVSTTKTATGDFCLEVNDYSQVAGGPYTNPNPKDSLCGITVDCDSMSQGGDFHRKCEYLPSPASCNTNIDGGTSVAKECKNGADLNGGVAREYSGEYWACKLDRPMGFREGCNYTPENPPIFINIAEVLFEDIDCNSGGCMAVGHSNSPGSGKGYLARSLDDGKTWYISLRKDQPNAYEDMFHVSLLNASEAFVAGRGGGIFYGRNWKYPEGKFSKQPTTMSTGAGVAGFILGLGVKQVGTDVLGFAGLSSQEVLKKTSGTNPKWTGFTGHGTSFRTVDDFAFSDDGSKVIATQSGGGEDFWIGETANTSTWQIKGGFPAGCSAQGVRKHRVRALDGNLNTLVFATGDGDGSGHGCLVKCVANAGTYTCKNTDPNNMALFGMDFAQDRQTGVAVGWGGAILVTKDGGETWKPSNSGVTYQLSSVKVLNKYSAVAVGNNGVALTTDDLQKDTVSWTKAKVIQQDFAGENW